MIKVKATREGLYGARTATGYLIQHDSWFVALPSTRALHRIVHIWRDVDDNPDGTGFTAPVLDVGPWNTDDVKYVFDGERPLAERGISLSGKSNPNGAGIDLSDGVWHALGLVDNGFVWWEFA